MSSDSCRWNNLLESDSWDCRQGVAGQRENISTASYNGYFSHQLTVLYLNNSYKLKADNFCLHLISQANYTMALEALFQSSKNAILLPLSICNEK